MKVCFLEPPLAKRTGGLDAAIGGLAAALTEQGLPVLRSDLQKGSIPPADIFHFHGLWEPRFAKLAASLRRNGKPYLVSPHGMLEPWAWRYKAWKKWPYYYLVERRFLRNAEAILSTAPSEAASISKLLPQVSVLTLPLGLTGDKRPDYETARRKLGWHEGERVILFLSRIHVKKGLELLLRALRGLHCPSNVRLVIVGGGDPTYVQSLKSYITNHRDSLPRIDWVGEVWGESRWAYFQSADLFCLPSHSENFGLAVLEALQVGTPVLTTTATPWPQYITRERGYIAEPTETSVQANLARFLSEPGITSAQRLSIADWAHAAFDWRTIASEYKSLYHRILAGN